jgi:hypothetical protein
LARHARPDEVTNKLAILLDVEVAAQALESLLHALVADCVRLSKSGLQDGEAAGRNTLPSRRSRLSVTLH